MGTVNVIKMLGVSLRATYTNNGTITGSDDSMNAMMMPLMNSANYGGNTVYMSAGLNFYLTKSALKGFIKSIMVVMAKR